MSNAPSALAPGQSPVTVCCRIRPRNPKADLAGGTDCMLVEGSSVRPVDRAGSFTFDAVFGGDSTQQYIFEQTAAPLVAAALAGVNVTFMTYGQTGSGKTFTMTGSRDDPGITPRVVDAIFRAIEAAPDTSEFTLRVSYMEVYMERVRDLLNPVATNLNIRQDAVRGIWVEGVIEEYVGSAEELLQTVRIGDANRVVGTTGMNDQSSRSHSVLQITMEVRDTVSRSLQHSKLYLVDLAGSESVSRTGAEGVTLDEARTINKSLFNLAKVINALTEEGAAAQHIPYRDSKLTRMLQDSLGGNSRTALIVCCSPCSSNIVESLSTLRFGQRAKKMKNTPVVNRVRSVEELERLLAKAEIAIDAQTAFIQSLQEQLEEVGRALTLPESERTAAIEHILDGEGSEEDAGAALSLGAAAATGAAAAGSSMAIVEAEESAEESWGGPSAWTASPAIAASAAPAASDCDDDGAPVITASLDMLGPSSPSAASFGGSGGGALVVGGNSITASQILELVSLRDEVALLQRQRDLDQEELAARGEEVRSASSALAAREAELEAAASVAAQQTAAAGEAGRAAAQAAALAALRSHECSVCKRRPFEELAGEVADGVQALHGQICYQLQEARGSLARAEERASVLQTEVNSLKNVISSAQAAPAAAAAAAAASVPLASSRASSSSGANSAGGGVREVVDIAAAQDLQAKLSSLMHVHRQLLRKYAVVDVECGEMGEVLRARDSRIADLTKASLSHGSALAAQKEAYEATIAAAEREHQAQLYDLRKDLLSLRAAPAPGSVSGVLRQGSGRLSEDGGLTVDGGARHVVKPIRGAGTGAGAVATAAGIAAVPVMMTPHKE